jgi:MFS family permease
MTGTGIPLVPLALEARGIDKFVIGLNGAMWSLGLILFGGFIPKVAARFGVLPTIWASLALNAAFSLVFALTDNLALWFVLRFASGAITGVPWLLTEIWINLVVEEKRRARALALYATLIAAGLAAGPLILQFVGAYGPAPFIACAVLALLVATPLAFAGGSAPRIAPEEGGRWLPLVGLAPLAMLAALIAGLGEAIVFIFLPLYALGGGLPANVATLWQTAFVVGSLTLQMPLGWLADHLNRALVLAGCAGVSAACALTLPFAGVSMWTAGPLLLLFGGAAWGIYTVGLAILGRQFAAGDMARANAAFIMVYTFGSLVGPPVVGGAMDLAGRDGLGWTLAVVYAACTVVGLAAMRRVR